MYNLLNVYYNMEHTTIWKIYGLRALLSFVVVDGFVEIDHIGEKGTS